MPDLTPRADLHPPHRHSDGRSPTDEEQRNVAAMERFRELFRRLIPSGNLVTLEASVVDESRPGWELSWWGIHTFDGEGRIVSDHTYLNRRDSPGISEMLGEASP